MNGFTTKELERPGLLKRLVGGKVRENAYIEIQNLLATKPLSSLTAADIINILSTYEIPREEALAPLLSFYETALRYFTTDANLSADERAALRQLRYALDLDDNAASEVEATVLRELFRGQLKKTLEDQVLS